MAFDYTNLYPDTSANGSYTKSWNYTTLDPIATVSASGYFNKVATRVGIGDSIIVSVVDAYDKTRTTLVDFATLYVNGISGGVVTTISSTSGIFANAALTGVSTAPTAAVDTSTAQIASTAFVVNQAGSATPLIDGTATVGTSTRFARQDHIHPTDTTRAPTASPTFTGTPAAPTAAVDTNTTQIATTAMVLAQAASATPLIDGTAAVGTSTRFARGDHVHPTDTTRAPLASPTFTGTPAAPTAAPGTNTTQVATTAFAVTEILARVASLDVAVYKGVIDCSANPNYPAADAGNTYRVSVAGKIGGASGTNVEVGDMMMCLTDGTASGTQAAVGANWDIIQANIDGAVVGPASAVSGRIATFNGATGKIIQDGGIVIGAGQYPGTTTNDNATAGNVGEYISSTVTTGALVALTTATPANVTNISLTAGDWDVSGLVGFLPANTTQVTQIVGSISTTSATLNTTPGNLVSLVFPATTYNGSTQTDAPMPPVRISLSGTTTVYLVAQSTFTVSGNGAFGIIRARRVR